MIKKEAEEPRSRGDKEPRSQEAKKPRTQKHWSVGGEI
jgi:hypothetical protein